MMDKKSYIENKIKGMNVSSTGDKTLGEDSLNAPGEIVSEMADKFLAYADMLVKRNEAVNLTAITEFEEIVTKHFMDSIAPFSKNVSRETFAGEKDEEKNTNQKYVSRETYVPGVKVVDVGTGAGFPGLPLKIVESGINLTLIDALRKRCEFLEDVCKELGADAEIIHARAEDAARDELLREKFDICVSRAVADLRILSEYCLPFVKPGGILIAYKSASCEEEVKGAREAIETLGGRISHIESVNLPETDITRKLVIIEKIKNTPEKFPRRAGVPEKKPL